MKTLLKTQIFPGILARKISGFRRIELVRRISGEASGEEVEFVTLMWFDSMADVRAFAGAQFAIAVVPPAARAVLKRFDATSAHYEVRDAREP